MSWIHDGKTYYGFGEGFVGLAKAQPGDENTCWARVLASLLNLSWGNVAKFTKLSDISEGQELNITREVIELLNKDLDGKDRAQYPYRLRETARWFGPSWGTAKTDAEYPVAVALSALLHWVIVLGVAINTEGTPTDVCYWDTDTKVKYVSYQEFLGYKPEASVGRVAR
jgi:hypothetical protein